LIDERNHHFVGHAVTVHDKPDQRIVQHAFEPTVIV